MARIFLLALWIAAGACLGGCARKPHTVTELHVPDARGHALALFEIDAAKGAVFIDSLYPKDDGKVSLRLPVQEPHIFAILTPASSKPLTLLPLAEEAFVLHLDYDALVSRARMEENAPSPVNRASIAYQQQVARTERRIDSIENHWMEERYVCANVDSLHKACVSAIEDLTADLRQEAERLCLRYTHTLLPVFVINRTAGGKTLFDLENRQDLDFLGKCAEEMNRNLPGNSHVERLLFHIARAGNHLERKELLHD